MKHGDRNDYFINFGGDTNLCECRKVVVWLELGERILMRTLKNALVQWFDQGLLVGLDEILLCEAHWLCPYEW